MKKSLILVACLILLSSSTTFAAYYFTGYISNDLLLSSQVPKGKTSVSLSYEMFSGTEFGAVSTVWMPAKDTQLNSYTVTVIPLKVAYGLYDNVSLRVTIPWVDQHLDTRGGGDEWGMGIGDIRIEGLYGLVKETAKDPAVDINVSLKTASGRNWGEKDVDQAAVGSGTTDIFFSSIFTKTYDYMTLKGLAGYAYTNPGYYQGDKYDPSEAYLFSGTLIIPQTREISYGAEIWSYIALSNDRMNDDPVDETKFTMVQLTPFVKYKASQDLTLRAAMDIPMGDLPSVSLSYTYLPWFRGANLTVGASWTI